MTKDFFAEAKEQSQVKTAIVTKYFFAWARAILPWAKKRNGKIAYIDLFAGPGRYDDGTISTPLVVLNKSIKNDDLRHSLVAIFNDANPEHASKLKQAIQDLPNVDTLEHQPQVWTKTVGTEIVEMFEDMSLIPTFFFVDPWGYKGLSLRLINSVLKDWGCDGIFFFNYNRINMGISNPIVIEHMNALFGEERANDLRQVLKGQAAGEREAAIVEAICSALREKGGKYVLPFRFRHPAQGRTSHHLIFVSKHVLGYEIMKSIMAKESSTNTQGVSSFEYNPQPPSAQGLLFELSRPLDELGNRLCTEFSGQTLCMKQIYNRHHVGTPFIKKNYKQVLADLETSGRIEANPPADERRRNTFADQVRVKFSL